ncbi:MAG: NADP-dependent oxidoreductase, partial [Candidatus Saccharimonas sp.]|nr:NADP-dependent oxidoreductase [Planctomycetaceae bacterium]
GVGVSAFSSGQEVFGFIPPTIGGTYAQYVAASSDALVSKPQGLDFINAASIPVVAMTAWQALFVVGGLAKGQSVLIHGGAGGVGMFAVQLAKWKGAHVTATASAKDLEFVRGLGADVVIDYKADRFEDKVSGVDVGLDLIGGETQQRSWRTMKPGGILVATPAPPSQEEATRHEVRAVMVHMQGDRAQLSTIAELIATGAIKTFVGATFPLADARKAQQASESGHVRGKIVLQIA